MKYVVFVLVLVLASAVFVQGVLIQTSQTKKSSATKPKVKPKPTPARRSTVAKVSRPRTTKVAAEAPVVPTPTPLTEKEQFDKASGYELATDRVAALQQFLTDFPESEHRPAAADLLASSRVLIAEEKLLLGSPADAISIFRRLVEEAPQPIPPVIFNESISKIPMTLFRRGQRAAAMELAVLIESKVENDAEQLADLANFYLSTENGAEAMRVTAKAMARNPESAAVHRTLALTHRINFDLELSADSYAKALELDPDSTVARRGLADMKRALGHPEEAIVLYRELLAKNDTDISSRTGLVLSLFDAGKRAEAEAALASASESAPANFVLLSGAAYWYASRGMGDRAVELAKKAVEREPRYIWSHIALARGLMAQGKPVAAEQALIKARAYGNFPTLEYEIASARVAAGFFRHAAEDLSKHFSVTSNGVQTRLGGRLLREESNLADLIAPERRASIFAPVAADSPENAQIIKGLLEFEQKLRSAEPSETEIGPAVDSFVKGSDKMKFHRQLYAASQLLDKKIALGKVLELTKAATGNTEAALEVADPAAAVMASELYEPRTVAFRRNDFLLVPEVPRPTLSSILRGRIEEISGWALYQQNNFTEAIVRLRRAISVIPGNSAWWRSSLWRLGAALEADGKDAEALDAYINSYKTDKPDFGKYSIVEALYTKVHGSTDGLEALIGSDHVATIQRMPDLRPEPTPAIQAADPAATSDTTEIPAASSSPVQTTEQKPEPSDPMEASSPVPTTEIKADPLVISSPTPTTETDPHPLLTKSPVPATEEKAKPTDPGKIDPSDAATEKRIKPADPTVTSSPEPMAEKKTEPPGPIVSSSPAPTAEQRSDPVKTDTADAAVQPAPSARQTPVQRTDELPAEKVNDEPAPKDAASEKKPVERNNDQTIPSDRRQNNEPSKNSTDPTTKPPLTDTKSANPRSIFDPVVITIPDNRPRRPKPAENSVADSGSDASGSVSTDPNARVGRLRVVKTDEAPAPCTIVVSQENVSLINNGGTLGLLVSVEGSADAKGLKAVSSSPKNLEVLVEPEIGGLPNRRFYVLRSISPALGVYQVEFAAPCGRKEVVVTVR